MQCTAMGWYMMGYDGFGMMKKATQVTSSRTHALTPRTRISYIGNEGLFTLTMY